MFNLITLNSGLKKLKIITTFFLVSIIGFQILAVENVSPGQKIKLALAQEILTKIEIQKNIDEKVIAAKKFLDKPLNKKNSKIDIRNEMIKAKAIEKAKNKKEDLSKEVLNKLTNEMAVIFTEEELKYWSKNCAFPGVKKMLQFLISNRFDEILNYPIQRITNLFRESSEEVEASEKKLSK